jgi:hypothetical protein
MKEDYHFWHNLCLILSMGHDAPQLCSHNVLLYWKCMNMLKSYNSYVNNRIKMAQ